MKETGNQGRCMVEGSLSEIMAAKSRVYGSMVNFKSKADDMCFIMYLWYMDFEVFKLNKK